LLYGQGGVAWINHSTNLTVNGFDFGDFGKTRTGWTAGGGVEWMFARGWSAFLEGNYMDFGDNDHTVIGPVFCPVGGCNFNTHAKAATVLVGVNYRFGWGKAPY
jgi:outer membrane immunogenic protein